MGSIIQGDALAELKKLPDKSFAVCVTSPPYNLGWSNPAIKAGKGDGRTRRWKGEYDGFTDRLEPDEYVAYHRAVIAEILRALQTDGLCWYVHRRRPNYKGGYTPALVDLVLAGMPVRSEIIWDKGGPGPGFCAAGPTGGAYFPTPAYESIFLLAKTQKAQLQRGPAASGDLWNVRRKKEKGVSHPATFPLLLVERCIANTLAQGPVLDPFGGSGTTAAAAAHANRDYLLIEQNSSYCEAARARLVKIESNPLLLDETGL